MIRRGQFICGRCAEVSWPGVYGECYECGAAALTVRWLDPFNLTTADLLPARGLPCSLSGEQIRDAYLQHVCGRSLREVGDELHQRLRVGTGGKSVAMMLTTAFEHRGWPRRERLAATVRRSTKHGYARRDSRYQTDEGRQFRAAQRRASGEVQGVQCRGESARRGGRCTRPAQQGSEYCRGHDPSLAVVVAANARVARQARAESAWPAEQIIRAIQLHAETTGRPPRISDWDASTAAHPSWHVARNRFGSWADAIEAAGYPRPARGRRA